MKKFKKYLPRHQHILKVNQLTFYYGFLVWLGAFARKKVYYHRNTYRKSLDRPVIVVANHLSGWDPFLIFALMKRKFFLKNVVWRLPAHYSQYKIFYKRLLFKYLGVYKIKREETLEKSLKTTVELVNRGHSIVFFPEGKRVAYDEKTKPKRGIGHLLKKTRAYVLPVHIEYSRRGWNGFGSYLGKCRFIFGELIESEYFVENFSDENRHEAVMNVVRALPKRALKKEEREPLFDFSNIWKGLEIREKERV